MRLRQLAARRRVLDRERALVVPDGLPLLLDCLCVVRVHRVSFVPRNEKASRGERPWEAGAAAAALLPGSGKKQVHATQCNHGLPMEPTLLPLFPDTAAVTDGELVLGGMRASELALEFGTPLVVYDELTLRRAGARLPRERARRARRLRHEGLPVARAAAALRRGRARRRRLDRRRARVRAARRHSGRASRRPRQQQGGRAADRRDCGGRADRARLARRARPRAGVRRDAVPDPRHARDRGRHARGGEDGAPRLEVRPAARRRTRGARGGSTTPRGCTCTSAPSSSTSARR